MRLVICCLAVLLCAICTVAQLTYTRSEFGVQGAYSFDPTDHNLWGFGERYTFNLNGYLAVDSDFTFYPQRTLSMANRGGRQFTFFSGLKGGVRRNRFGIFGKMRPGLRHYTETALSGEAPNLTDNRTHFAVDLGGVLEYYPTRRWILRLDVGEALTRHGDHVDLRVLDSQGRPVYAILATATVADSFSATTGVSYRWGQSRQESSAAYTGPARFQAGIQYSLINLVRGDEMRAQQGPGGWLSYSLTRHVALDTAFSYHPQNPQYIGSQQGGTIVQGLFGVKTGIERRRFGIFAKARPGFMRFSKTLTDYSTILMANPDLHFHPATQFSFDAGGVVEIYPSRRLVLRFDLGDTTTRYSSRPILLSSRSAVVPGFTNSAIQLSTGVGFRF
jgi:hypothetical protein